MVQFSDIELYVMADSDAERDAWVSSITNTAKKAADKVEVQVRRSACDNYITLPFRTLWLVMVAA